MLYAGLRSGGCYSELGRRGLSWDGVAAAPNGTVVFMIDTVGYVGTVSRVTYHGVRCGSNPPRSLVSYCAERGSTVGWAASWVGGMKRGLGRWGSLCGGLRWDLYVEVR